MLSNVLRASVADIPPFEAIAQCQAKEHSEYSRYQSDLLRIWKNWPCGLLWRLQNLGSDDANVASKIELPHAQIDCLVEATEPLQLNFKRNEGGAPRIESQCYLLLRFELPL